MGELETGGCLELSSVGCLYDSRLLGRNYQAIKPKYSGGGGIFVVVVNVTICVGDGNERGLAGLGKLGEGGDMTVSRGIDSSMRSSTTGVAGVRSYLVLVLLFFPIIYSWPLTSN